MAQTALDQYDRLEALGLWREGPGLPEREVIVSFGQATLTLRDTSEAPLAHWSLAALETLEESTERLVLSPDPTGAERLVLTDPDMIEAIRRVSRVVAPRPTGRKRRLSAWILGLVLALPIAAGLVWPDRVARQVTPLLPDPIWLPLPAQIMARETARPDLFWCREGPAPGAPTAALARLIAKLDPEGRLDVRVARFEGPPMINAGGAQTLLNARSLRDMAQPEELAGLIALAAARATASEYRAALGEAAGPRGLLALMFQRPLGPDELDAARAVVLSYPAGMEAVDADTLRRLGEAGLPSLPLVLTLASGGAPEPRLERIVAGDTVRGAEFTPALTDAAWLRLQASCQD